MLLKKCLDAGYRIGSIFDASDDELHGIVERSGSGSGRFTDILDHIQRLDKDAIEQILVERFLLLGPSAFAIEYVSPLMKIVGDLWARGDLSVGSEHLISSAVRSILGSALKPARGQDARLTAVFCTPEGDVHELGTLIAALLAQECDMEVYYFGAQLPIIDISKAVRKLGAKAVCLGSTWLSGPDLLNWVGDLREILPGSVELWVGGAGFAAVRAELPARTRLFYSLEDLESFLQVQLAVPRAAQ
ncbi:B12-binding domain-containing protein [Hoeflea sp.]|uniref:cobalamin B12-binding domain-containing protein n=1 Tax=Hoeflea sp. TaxID=1940281 RepID=UPI003748265F